jgi:hypothetical protein
VLGRVGGGSEPTRALKATTSSRKSDDPDPGLPFRVQGAEGGRGAAGKEGMVVRGSRRTARRAEGRPGSRGRERESI